MLFPFVSHSKRPGLLEARALVSDSACDIVFAFILLLSLIHI